MSTRLIFAALLLSCGLLAQPQIARAETFNTCAGFIIIATNTSTYFACAIHSSASSASCPN